MRVSSVSNVDITPALHNQTNVQNRQGTQNNSKQDKTNSHQVAFGIFFDDMRYYFARTLELNREVEKGKQFRTVRNRINNDIAFIAERQGISLKEASAKYEDKMDRASLPLHRNGNEEGLNKVVGYSVEKYQALSEVVLPMVAEKDREEDDTIPPVPNGVLLYGPQCTGKSHFAKALGEHLEKKGVAEFKKVRINQVDLEKDNPMNLLAEFDQAEDRKRYSGKRQVLFFDDMETIFDKNREALPGVFLALVKDCAKKGITWVGTVNDPKALSPILFKPSRLNSDICFDKMCDSEKSAVMSYHWMQKNRKDESDHFKIIDENKTTGFRFYPPQVGEVADAVDEELKKHHDRASYLYPDVKVKKPVTTEIVSKNIKNYLDKNREYRFDEMTDSDVSDNQLEYVKAMRVKYADKA